MNNKLFKIICYVFILSLFPEKVFAQREIDTKTLVYAMTKMGKDDTGLLDCIRYNLTPEDSMSADYTAKEFMKKINNTCYNEEVRFYNKCLLKTGLSKEICLGIAGTMGPMEISLRDGNILKLGPDGHYQNNDDQINKFE